MLDVSYEKVIPSLVQRQFFQNVRFWVSYDGRPIEERFWRFAPRSNIFIKSKGANFCGMTADVFVVEYGTVLLDDGAIFWLLATHLDSVNRCYLKMATQFSTGSSLSLMRVVR